MEEVRRLLVTYAVAVDAKRWDLFDRVFTEDVVADYGYPEPYRGREAWKQAFDVHHRVYQATQHAIHNDLAEVDGDAGTCLSYSLFTLVSGERIATGGCWYDDTLVRTADGWRISRRVCRVIWMRDDGKPVPGLVPEPLQDAAAGGRIGVLGPQYG